MSYRSKQILIWVVTLLLTLFVFKHLRRMKKHKVETPAVRVDSFPDHSEIPRYQEFEQFNDTRLINQHESTTE